MPIEALQNELLGMVFDHLWSTDLVKCQLVSPSWKLMVGLHPFTKVEFKTETGLVKFVNYLQASRYSVPQRNLLVKHIKLNIAPTFSHNALEFPTTKRYEFDFVNGQPVTLEIYFLENFRDLMKYCSETRSITCDGSISSSTPVLRALCALPRNIQLDHSEEIPGPTSYHYRTCAKKIGQSLTKLVFWSGSHLDNKILLNYEFPQLTKLTLCGYSDSWPLVYSVLNTSTRLADLMLSTSVRNPPVSMQSLPTVAMQYNTDYPSLKSLCIRPIHVNYWVDYERLNTFFFRFIHLEILELTVHDEIYNSSSPPPQHLVSAFNNCMLWKNKLKDSSLYINTVKLERVLTYIALIFNTIPKEKEK